MDEKNIFDEIKELIVKDKFNNVFYNKNLSHREIMMISQNPGKSPSKKEEDNIKKYGSFEELIGTYQKGLLEYLQKSNKRVWEELFDEVGVEINRGLFDKIYFTDLDKSRKENKSKRKNRQLLMQEIKKVKPKIIISFGKKVFDFFKENFEINGIHKTDNLRDVHGKLFRLKKEDIFLIPLIHHSPQATQNCPRSSYIDYFKKGWRKYLKNN